MKTTHIGIVLAWLATLFLLTACGGGGGSPTPPPTLSKIAVTPASPSVALGLASQFTATGTYSDGSTANITNKANWTSSDPTVATINSSGLASTYGLIQGNTNITATLGSVTSNTASLAVGPPVLTSINISPAPANTLLSVPTTTFSATTGNMSDGTTVPVSSVTWTSSNHAVAIIDNTTGVATTVAVGSTNIVASSGGASSTEVLTIYYGGFSTTGNMTAPRSAHTATLLSDGTRVLLAGGTDSSGALQSTGLFDGTSAFTVTGSMATARTGHTATLLPSGDVLVAGGVSTSSAYLNTAVLFDGTSTFASTGSLVAATARAYHTATLLLDGTVLIAGGFDGTNFLKTAELYDPGTGFFTATGNMTVSRGLHTATLLTNGPNIGKVLITGGTDGSIFHKTAELFDPTGGVGSFTATGSMTQAREYHTATLLSDGATVLITGGDTGGVPFSSAELFNGTGFTATGSMTTARTGHTATLLPSNDVLVAGGYGNLAPAPINCSTCTYLKSAELYGSTSGSFGTTGDMTTARQYHTATLLTNGPNTGKVLITGGTTSGNAPTDSAELF